MPSFISFLLLIALAALSCNGRADARSYLIASTDAGGGRRTLGYDNTTNVTSRSDARGHLTRFVHDERNQLISEAGPADGQLTTYAYDPAGNRTHETWANGNVRVSTYDTLERREGTTDSMGPVESMTYAPDDQMRTRTTRTGTPRRTTTTACIA